VTLFGQRGTLAKAERLISQDQFENAISLLEKHLERYPQHISLYKPLARAYAALDQWDSAEHALQRALEVSPANPTLLLFIGELFFQAERFTDAIAALEKCLHKQPDNQLALNYLAVSLYKIGEQDKALEILRDFGLSNNVEFLCEFAATFEDEVRNNPEFYRDPPRELIYARSRWLYQIFVKTQNLGIINKFFKPIARWRLLRLATKLLMMGHSSGALNVYNLVLEFSAEDTDALTGKGIAFLELKKYERAKDIFIKLVEQNEGNNLFLVYLSLCYYFQKKYHTSIAILERISSDGLEDFNANYYLGLNRLALGDRDAACKAFRTAFTKFYVDTMEDCVKDLLERILYSHELEESQKVEQTPPQ
jgi:tetratricopeptide (TPR) repeat protein